MRWESKGVNEQEALSYLSYYYYLRWDYWFFFNTDKQPQTLLFKMIWSYICITPSGSLNSVFSQCSMDKSANFLLWKEGSLQSQYQEDRVYFHE